jgi:YD repeat-containing protein
MNYAITNAPTERDKSILTMQRDNIINRQIENSSGIVTGGTEYMTGSVRNDFKRVPNEVTVPDMIWGFNSSAPIAKTTFDQNPASYYRQIGTFVKYDNTNNIVERAKDKDISSSFIWDYNNEYPIAEIVNSSADDFAYTSFEASGSGNWSTINSSGINAADGRTGKRSYSLTLGSLSKSILIKKYTISLWSKSGTGTVILNGTTLSPTSVSINGWQYFETSITGTATNTTATISGTALIDELRLFPSGALITTYTFDPLIGVTSQTDANNQTIFYDYDALGRLTVMKDTKGNILKTYKYNYKQ